MEIKKFCQCLRIIRYNRFLRICHPLPSLDLALSLGWRKNTTNTHTHTLHTYRIESWNERVLTHMQFVSMCVYQRYGEAICAWWEQTFCFACMREFCSLLTVYTVAWCYLLLTSFLTLNDAPLSYTHNRSTHTYNSLYFFHCGFWLWSLSLISGCFRISERCSYVDPNY